MISSKGKGGHQKRLVASDSVLPPSCRVYCNRKLKMSRIHGIGFDMDHTLAIYRPEAIEPLAYRLTIEKLVEAGYPPSLRDLEYDRTRGIRGLAIDKVNGNVIKMDRYKYVTRVFHGSRELDAEERRKAYASRRLDLALEDFQNVDTLFTLPEVCLYLQMVDLADAMHPKSRWPYRKLYDDIRNAIDQSHRDGSLKSEVLSNIGKYFEIDPDLPETLIRMRDAGKKVFLLTNSELYYTEAVMSYILPRGPGQKPWYKYFDLINVSARKPKFFMDGTPFELDHKPDYKVVTGGSTARLEALLGVSGEEILYFGDHTYGDIMKSKKFSLWRTAMVIEELDQELAAYQKTRSLRKKLQRLYTTKGDLQDRISVEQELVEKLRGRKLESRGRIASAEELVELDTVQRQREKTLRSLDTRLSKNLLQITEVEAEVWKTFNPYWGAVFRAGTETSRLGDQLEDFACVYTSRVSNFLHYPVNKYFQSPRERMVHEI